MIEKTQFTDLYEYKCAGNEGGQAYVRVAHIWITENEFKVAQWVLAEDGEITARVFACPEDCDYRKLPHPNRKPHGATNLRNLEEKG